MNYCHDSAKIDSYTRTLGQQEAQADSGQSHALSLVPEMVSHVLGGSVLEWGNKRLKSYRCITLDDLQCKMSELGKDAVIINALHAQDAIQALHHYNKIINQLAIDNIKEALEDYEYELPHQFKLNDAA